ncbi:hypothetical protein [Aliiglaciecola lipolytica]|uniref:Uncharacterized protein n=1 Tax=Aliiglaciecola lipolytica E3 TaxID=1127673 RepID=K6X675_9ALTE|nr:hypothetical protein [Aliiglaciecola lipolytica]GAC16124.1 hypothetical protein GLIP_3511 [Aliiglaciecola lipolytica E3]
MYKIIMLSLGLLSLTSIAHQGHVDDTALQACVDKTKSQSCGYVSSSLQLHLGSCQQFKEHLICVRNKPFESITDRKLAELRAAGEITISDRLSKRHAPHDGH